MRVPEQDPKAAAIPLRLALPPIALSELKEPTKDFLLAKANAGATPLETMKELLDRGAERAGFRARRSAAAEASRAAEAWAAAGGLEASTVPEPAGRTSSNINTNTNTQEEGGDES